MANTAAQFGFRHIDDASGGSPTYRLSTYRLGSTGVNSTTTIGFGDPVWKVNSTSQYITRATPPNATSQPIVGIFYGCQLTSPTSGFTSWSPAWPATAQNGDSVAYVVDSPNALFIAAVNQTAITAGNIGQFVNFTGGTASTVGGMLSTATIEQATLTSNLTAFFMPFVVRGLYPGVGNGSDPTTNFNWVVVGFANQSYKSVTGF